MPSLSTDATVIPAARFQAHSIALAEARGETVCSHKARTIGVTLGDSGALVNAAWRIASASHPDGAYIVTFTAADDRAECECVAAQYGRPCWHAGLAQMMGAYLVSLYSKTGRATSARQAARDAAHESNAAALGF